MPNVQLERYQIFTYTVNALQGVLIFIALVCKKTVLGKLLACRADPRQQPNVALVLRDHAVRMIDLTNRHSNATATTTVPESDSIQEM